MFLGVTHGMTDQIYPHINRNCGVHKKEYFRFSLIYLINNQKKKLNQRKKKKTTNKTMTLK